MPTREVAGFPMYYEECGSGRPLLLVHGFPLSHEMWTAQLEGLCDVCRVIAPDLRGFGRSGGDVSSLTMEQLADDLNEFVEALGIEAPITLCGLSMGGYVALPFVHKYASRVDSLILCDSRSAADSVEAVQARRDNAERVLATGAESIVEAMRPKLFAEATRTDRPEVVDVTLAMIRGTSPATIAAALRGMAVRPDMTDTLGRITVPTLVLVGENDVITPVEEMRRMAAAIPNARFVVVPDVGHMAPMEAPEVVNRHLCEFLSELSSMGGA